MILFAVPQATVALAQPIKSACAYDWLSLPIKHKASTFKLNKVLKDYFPYCFSLKMTNPTLGVKSKVKSSYRRNKKREMEREIKRLRNIIPGLGNRSDIDEVNLLDF